MLIYDIISLLHAARYIKPPTLEESANDILMIEWYNINNPEMFDSWTDVTNAAVIAATAGNLEVMKILCNKRHNKTEAVKAALLNGHGAIAKLYSHINHLSMSRTLMTIVDRGDLELVLTTIEVINHWLIAPAIWEALKMDHMHIVTALINKYPHYLRQVVELACYDNDILIKLFNTDHLIDIDFDEVITNLTSMHRSLNTSLQPYIELSKTMKLIRDGDLGAVRVRRIHFQTDRLLQVAVKYDRQNIIAWLS